MTPLRNLIFRKPNQILIDIVVFGFSWAAAFFVRFEGLPAGRYLDQMFFLALFVIAARVLLFQLFSVYTIVWRYISIRDAFLIVKAAAPLSLMLLAVRLLAPEELGIVRAPISVIFIEFLIAVLGTAGVRMIRRLVAETDARDRLIDRNGGHKRNILLGPFKELVNPFLHRPGTQLIGCVRPVKYATLNRTSGGNLPGTAVQYVASPFPKVDGQVVDPCLKTLWGIGKCGIIYGCTQRSIGLEKATNPFLRAPALAGKVGAAGQPDAWAFAAVRAAKDNFKG